MTRGRKSSSRALLSHWLLQEEAATQKSPSTPQCWISRRQHTPAALQRPAPLPVSHLVPQEPLQTPSSS